MTGKLTVVGAGHRAGAQVTVEAEAHIKGAERVFHLCDDALTIRWLEQLNATATTLVDCLREGQPGYDAIPMMVERMLTPLRDGASVCAVFPGHPTIAVAPCQELLRRARAEGHQATVLPGVSAVDCLFADLGLDPASTGWQVFDATDFLVHRRRLDPTSVLILLQIGVIGLRDYSREHLAVPAALEALSDALRESYSGAHEVILYQASPNPIFQPRVEHVALSRLPVATMTFTTTLYVPARSARPPDPEVLKRIGLGAPDS